MQESETLKTPGGHEVIIRGYVTGLIDREIKKVQASANKATYTIDAEGMRQADPNSLPENGKMVMETDPTANLKADEKLLELMVSAVDGSTGDVFHRLMELPSKDVNFVLDRVKELYDEGEVAAADPKAPSN